MSKEHLATYLNDHWSRSAVALDLLAHIGAEAADLEPELARLKADIEADRKELKTLMDRFEISESRIRKVTGWFSEQLTEAKLEVDDEAGGDLHRLEALDTVAAGLDAVLGLWAALGAAAEASPELRGPDYDLLAQRAIEQRRQLEAYRLKAARSALPV